ncbi:RNA-binding protein 2-like [Hibiscus syriacus]|uniref:RNA-binding protein 2-like n=1 Tax=Hibiscus syriacus TaxID=106335 RepID=UPI0019208CEA|nr:RNA-binding protein 2-like [Hibiscus syriacus]
MANSYWRYSNSRQPPPSTSIPPFVGKRTRSDYVSGGHELSSYYSQDDGGAMRVTGDGDFIGASYDRYLHGTQLSSFSGSARPMSGGMPRHSVDDPHMVGIGGVDPEPTIKDRTLRFGSGRPEPSLPPDASSTLYVEGLPSDCTRREVSHIFRPFVGYKEVRLVTKEPRYPGGDPIKLCFVDFLSPSHAATSKDALQGYIFNEHGHDSVKLRLQFARHPGARVGGGHRGKR